MGGETLTPRSRPVRAVAALGVAYALAASFAAAAEEPSPRGWAFELSLDSVVVGGDSTYRIETSDGPDHVASELEFPLASVMLRVQAQFASRAAPGERRFVLHASAMGAPRLGVGFGKMKDSDWFSDSVDVSNPAVGAPHEGKDIYSESDVQLAALVLEARAEWELPATSGLVLAPMIGMLYQRFEFDVSNVRQVGYGPYGGSYSVSGSGRVLDYRASYRAPYLGARAALAGKRLGVAADAWFSPIATAADRDDHLLRWKLSETKDASGSAWQASVSARLALGPRDFVQAQVSTVRFRATGTQHQRFYAGPDAGVEYFVDSTITSKRNAFFLGYAHRL